MSVIPYLQDSKAQPQPLVSVLITNYNYAHYLKEAIDSALNQTYPYLEVIVVDDGSTDSSREVILNYGDKIIPFFKENGGQASAVNTGFHISKGEIICFLDSDDVWLPTKVEQVVEVSCQYPNAVVFYHKVQNIDETGTPTGNPWPPYKVIRGDISKQVAQAGGWWPFPPSTALGFKRSFLSRVMDIPEQEYRLSAEPYLTDLAPFFGDIVGIDHTLSLFRVHGANNWSYPVDLERRCLENHEVRTSVLNNTLKVFGIDVKIELSKHYPYQLLRYKLGYSKDLIHLSRLALQVPWVSGFILKSKFLFRLWLDIGLIQILKNYVEKLGRNNPLKI
jgi:glycosyltransferase involved in cell wall biosynthesis